MKLPFFAFFVFLGGAILLALYLADRDMKLGEDRLFRMKKLPDSLFQGDLNLRLVSERSPHMRTELNFLSSKRVGDV